MADSLVDRFKACNLQNPVATSPPTEFVGPDGPATKSKSRCAIPDAIESNDQVSRIGATEGSLEDAPADAEAGAAL